MEHFNEGDIVTLSYFGDRYLVAKIIYVEKLTLHDLIHLKVYDRIVSAGPEGYDDQGELQPRTHEIIDVTGLPVVVDHLAMTASSFEESDPMTVGHEDVAEEELEGYQMWVALRRARAEQSGLIRYDVDKEDETYVEYVDEEVDVDGDELESAGVNDDDIVEVDGDVGGDDVIASDPYLDGGLVNAESVDAGDSTEPVVHTWHDTVFDAPVSQIFLELADIFRKPEFEGTAISQSVHERTDADNEVVANLIDSFLIEGDYSAGQELLDYGDGAAALLNARLYETTEEQRVEDILQILSDMGSDQSYGYIAEYLSHRLPTFPDNPLSLVAAKAFAYVVMLTGGTPAPLRQRIDLLDRIDHPDTHDDVIAAKEAVTNASLLSTDVGESTERSTDPFAAM